MVDCHPILWSSLMNDFIIWKIVILNLSANLLHFGFLGVVRVFLISRRWQTSWNNSDSKHLHWSVWIDKGHPNFVMNSLHTVFAHVGSVWSGTWYASAHLLKWSVRTSMCWFPCTDSGNWPTRSMDILSSRAPVRMSPRGARGLRLFHFWTHIAYFNPNVKIFSYLEPIESLL